LFIFAVSLHQVTNGVGNARGSFDIGNSVVMLQQVQSTSVWNDTLSFNPPLIIKTDENLSVSKNNNNSNHISRCNVTGFLLDVAVAGMSSIKPP
jgi:hypothetical protein